MASQADQLSFVEDAAAKFATWNTVYWALSVLLTWQIIWHLQQIFRSDLRGIPGPVIARLTAYWRPWALLGGQAPEVYYDLHRKYGPLVRTAPGVVSISDPAAISKIYGIGSKFHKVSNGPSYETLTTSHHLALRIIEVNTRRPCSTACLTSPTKTPPCQACFPFALRPSIKPCGGQSRRSSP